VWVVTANPWSVSPREWHGTHCIGGLVGPRAGQDVFVKSRPPTGCLCVYEFWRADCVLIR